MSFEGLAPKNYYVFLLKVLKAIIVYSFEHAMVYLGMY